MCTVVYTRVGIQSLRIRAELITLATPRFLFRPLGIRCLSLSCSSDYSNHFYWGKNPRIITKKKTRSRLITFASLRLFLFPRRMRAYQLAVLYHFYIWEGLINNFIMKRKNCWKQTAAMRVGDGTSTFQYEKGDVEKTLYIWLFWS